MQQQSEEAAAAVEYTELVAAVIQQWLKDAIQVDGDGWYQMVMYSRAGARICPVICWFALILGREPDELLGHLMALVRHIRKHPEHKRRATYSNPVLKRKAQSLRGRSKKKSNVKQSKAKQS